MSHEEYVITIRMDVCEGMVSKVLEEIKRLRMQVEGNAFANKTGHFDHADNVRWTLDHKEIK